MRVWMWRIYNNKIPLETVFAFALDNAVSTSLFTWGLSMICANWRVNLPAKPNVKGANLVIVLYLSSIQPCQLVDLLIIININQSWLFAIISVPSTKMACECCIITQYTDRLMIQKTWTTLVFSVVCKTKASHSRSTRRIKAALGAVLGLKSLFQESGR